MATLENVCAARILLCQFQGKPKDGDVTRLTRTISIRESICSPYITAEMIVLDNTNTIVNLKLKGGDRCDVILTAFTGKTYSLDLYVLDVKAASSPDLIDLKVYTISLCTSEYFTDQGVRTPETTDVQQTGVQLIHKIWGEAGFKTGLSDKGQQDAPLQDGNQPLTIGLMKPFTAIGQVRDIQVYPQWPTGNVLLYRDAKQENIVPLQYIYETCTGSVELIQKQTWGTDYKNMFIGGEADRAIISIHDNTRSTMLDPKAFRPSDQSKSADDIAKGKYGARIAMAVASGLKNAAHAMTNSDKTSTPIDFTNIMDKARCYAICLKAQIQYEVRIPFQSGINITVGQGVNLKLTPTTSDGKTELINPNDGTYLVTDLVHEVHNDLREVLGTTTLQCLQTGADCGV